MNRDRDNGKENGSYRDYRDYKGYIRIMEKKMETIGRIGRIVAAIWYVMLRWSSSVTA